ncbi:MAG: PD-(D/E)XK nuclease family protein, partial [Clostridia bacterium]|nr:PD-(D/E)XK nuclease family protein [Clostridia bacterium]
MPDIQIWTGRSHRLLAPVVDSIGALHKQGADCLWLVPEQFTLQAERELLVRLSLKGFFNIQVLSPSRLGERVLAATGRLQGEPLAAPGRQMAISQALERCAEKLCYYHSSVRRQGFIQKLGSLVADMKQGGLTPERLSEYAASMTEGGEKLRDIATLYEAYQQVLSDRFSDDEDRLRYVASRLPQSGLLRGQHVFVYGFDTLPHPLMALLCAMAGLCDALTVALVCDGENAPDGELYIPIRKSVSSFMDRLKAQGLAPKLHPLLPIPLPAEPVIRHLDQHLYAHPQLLFHPSHENIFLAQHQSPFEEAVAAARQIHWLIIEKGVDLDRIALLYPNQSGYAFAVSASLRDAGLPFHSDQKLPAASHGLVRYLLYALRAMAEGYRNDDITGMLFSGYAPLSFEESCTLRNYAVSYGIDRARWAKPFIKGPEEHCATCEALRLRLMEPLQRARGALVDARDARASLAAVFGLLQDAGVYEGLKREEQALLQNQLLARANQNSQIWETVLTILDQLYMLQGGARIPLKHIADRLECGFGVVSLASLPPTSHMLHVGTLGHYLSGEMEAVFILGLNDGVLTRSTESLLTKEERTLTENQTGAYLGITDESRATFARLDLKRAMTLPSRWLFLSHSKTDPMGAALRPLSLLGTLQKKILSHLPQSPVPWQELPYTPAQALAELGLLLRAYMDGDRDSGSLPERWQVRLQDLLADASTAESAMCLLRAANHHPQARPLPVRTASALFGDQALSVSRLEEFSQCAFKHFVQYGLRPQTATPWKAAPLDMGNFYHAGLHHFAELAGCRTSFPHIADDEAAALADEAVLPLIDDLMQGPMGDGAMSQAAFARARQTLRRAAVTITRHLKAGRFTLSQTEAAFGYPGGMPPIVLTLPDGRQIMLRGKIDRIDYYIHGEATYLRVIDYKSGRYDLDTARTWWGLQLQLLLYLDACVAAIPNALPAGAFYFYVADPLVESDEDIKALAEEKLRELLLLRGIALADVEILTAMNEGDLPIALPIMLNKSGGIKSGAKALELSQMQALLRHARDVAARLAQGIFNGETAIAPVQDGSKTACDYCGYRDV